MRFTSLVRLTGSTGWKFQLLFQWPSASLKLLNWFVIDHRLLTGLVSFRFNSLADSSGPSGSAAVALAVAGALVACATSFVVGSSTLTSPQRRVSPTGASGVDRERPSMVWVALDTRGVPMICWAKG